MRKLSYICLVSIFSLGFAITASAQDKPNTPKTDEMAKTEKQAPADTKKGAEEPIDIDAFFKRGEEAAKKGSECSKPAEPVA